MNTTYAFFYFVFLAGKENIMWKYKRFKTIEWIFVQGERGKRQVPIYKSVQYLFL